MSEPAPARPTLPLRIEHPRFVLRCHDEADAARVKEVVDRNLDHLRPFMPWAWSEPMPLEEKAAMMREARAKFLRGEDWGFGLYDADETRLLGAIGMHRSAEPDTLEIGYWICRSAEGQGYVTEAARLLTNLALTRLGAARVEIRCNVLNERSAAVPRRLGFTLAGERDEIYAGEPRRAQTWARTEPV